MARRAGHMTPKMERLRRRLIANRRTETIACVLGDADGQVKAIGRIGYVWVREVIGVEDAGTSYGQPFIVRHMWGATYPLYAGFGVAVGLDHDNELAVLGGDFNSAIERDIDPAAYNIGNPFANQKTNLDNVSYLRPFTISSSSSDSTEIGIKPFLYRDRFGQYQIWNPDADDRVDLATYAPGTSGQKRLVLVYLNTSNELAVVQGTAKNESLLFNHATDVSEVVDAMPSNGIPIAAWSIANGQTKITSADLFVDLRQWISTPDKIYLADTAPDTDDDSDAGFDIGHRWIDTTNDAIYWCLDSSSGAAVWTSGAGSAPSPGISNVVTKTSDYTATTADDTILVDCTGDDVTITLYTASGNAGRNLSVKLIDNSGNTLTIDGNGAETIDGSTTIDLTTTYAAVRLQSDGTSWWLL